MMMAVDVPDEVVMPPVLGVASHDGEVCQQLLDAPAGAWTAVVLESVDVSKLSALELPAYLQGLARVQAWAGAHIAAGVVPDHVIPYPIRPTQIPLDRPWHNAKTKKQLTVSIDHDGHVHMTTVLGQSRTVTPYDYRMTSDAADEGASADQLVSGDSSNPRWSAS